MLDSSPILSVADTHSLSWEALPLPSLGKLLFPRILQQVDEDGRNDLSIYFHDLGSDVDLVCEVSYTKTESAVA